MIFRTTILIALLFTVGPILGAQDQPNIILIMADDLGWQDVEFAGARFFETPHIDHLASQGMTFTAAYSGGPNCAPTRACLMSGTYTPRHQIYTPGGRSKGKPEYMRLLVPAVSRKNKALAKEAAAQFPITNSLDPAFVCIPEVLQSAGYTSARLGKWHLGDDTQGFDLSSSNGKGGPASRRTRRLAGRYPCPDPDDIEARVCSRCCGHRSKSMNFLTEAQRHREKNGVRINLRVSVPS